MLLRRFPERPYHFLKSDGPDIFEVQSQPEEHIVSKPYISFVTISRSNNSVNKDLYRKGPDRLMQQMLTVPAAINPEKSLLWDPDPGPSSPSGLGSHSTGFFQG